MSSPQSFSVLDAGVAIAENIKLLILGPLLVGIVAFTIVSTLPKTYTSVAYLALAEPPPPGMVKDLDNPNPPLPSPQATETLMRSPVVLRRVLAKFGTPDDAGTSLEARIRAINKKIRLSAGLGGRKTATMFQLEVDQFNPERAQAINTALIETWLDEIKPKSGAKDRLEDALARNAAQIKSVTALIERLEKETAVLVAPGSLQGEFATPLVNLHKERTLLLAANKRLQAQLVLNPQDYVILPPNLPSEYSGLSSSLVAILSALVCGLILLIFLILRHAARMASPENARKLARIRAAFLLQRKSPIG